MNTFGVRIKADDKQILETHLRKDYYDHKGIPDASISMLVSFLLQEYYGFQYKIIKDGINKHQ